MLVFQRKIGAYLISIFYSEFIGAICIPVGGLQPPQKWIRKIDVCNFNRFLDYLGIKYHGISSKFGMCVSLTSFYNIFSDFL